MNHPLPLLPSIMMKTYWSCLIFYDDTLLLPIRKFLIILDQLPTTSLLHVNTSY